MRVLYCTDTYPPQVNGVSVVTALSVAGLRERGWDCAVVSPRYPAGERNPFADVARERGGADAHVTLPSVPFAPYPDIRLAAPLLPRVERAVREFQPDLVHCATEFMVGRLGQVAARRAGVPVVTSYHTDFSRYCDAYGAGWLRPHVSRYISRFHARAVRTYTPSTPACADLHANGVTHGAVWGRGVDTALYHPSRRSHAIRESFGAGDRLLLLHVGRLAAEKGVERLLAGYALATRLLPAESLHLIVAGTGPREAALRARAPAGVSFVGHLDRQRALPELYASCDGFLFASVTETLGLVVLEAMSSGLPVVAVPAGGVADHLRDDVNGLAYPAGDEGALAHAIVRLALERELRLRLAAGARRTAESLDWSVELDRLDASYREVLRARSRFPASGVSTRPTRVQRA